MQDFYCRNVIRKYGGVDYKDSGFAGIVTKMDFSLDKIEAINTREVRNPHSR